MKLKLFTAVAVASTLGLAGCAGLEDRLGTDRQTLGTIGGAAAGGVVGSELIGGPLGTLGGAAAGGYLGNRATDPNRR